MRYLAASATILTVVTLTACHTWQDRGLPLKDFKAKNSAYFPQGILKFFRSANDFQRDYHTKRLARAGIKLIEVKQLNSKSSNNNEANLSWSADGYYLSYESNTFNNRQIMLKDLPEEYARTLAVLPKGRDTFLEGSISRELQSYNSGLSWSKDSTRFAFMSNGGVGSYNIYIGAVGLQEYPIAQSPTKDGYATWSPSQNELVFVSARSGNGDIYLLDIESENLKRLSDSPYIDVFPEWSPMGDQIVYSSGPSSNHSLFLLRRPIATGEWQKPEKITDWPHDDLRPTISPDGKFVAFYSNSGYRGGQFYWNIHVVPLRKSKPFRAHELKHTVVARDVMVDLNTGPAWSPDSRKIFYIRKDSRKFNPICAYDLFLGKRYVFKTGTKMNRDILISKLGIMSFRAQVGAWDRVFVALTNQGLQLQTRKSASSLIHYLNWLPKG